MWSAEALREGLTKKRKKPVTRPIRQKAIASMISTSLPKTDRIRAGRRAASLMGAADETISEPAHGLDEGGMAGVVVELLAQAGDEDVDRPVEGLPLHAARRLHDPLPGEGAPLVAEQQGEQLELGGGEIERGPVQ